MQTPSRPGLRIREDCHINLSENERGRVCTQLADPHLPRPGAGWVRLAFVYTSVVVPDSLNPVTNPDPAFQVNPDPDPGF